MNDQGKETTRQARIHVHVGAETCWNDSLGHVTGCTLSHDRIRKEKTARSSGQLPEGIHPPCVHMLQLIDTTSSWTTWSCDRIIAEAAEEFSEGPRPFPEVLVRWARPRVNRKDVPAHLTKTLAGEKGQI
jgi:hypothetical protein